MHGISTFPTNIYLFIVNNTQCNGNCSEVFIVNFEHISHLFLVFLSLYLFAGKNKENMYLKASIECKFTHLILDLFDRLLIWGRAYWKSCFSKKLYFIDKVQLSSCSLALFSVTRTMPFLNMEWAVCINVFKSFMCFFVSKRFYVVCSLNKKSSAKFLISKLRQE